jgi:hypothetical protein
MIKEEIFARVLRLLEEGKTEAQIIAAFPSDEEDIKDFLKIIQKINGEGQKISPSPKFLNQIIQNISVTKNEEGRYIYEGQNNLVEKRIDQKKGRQKVKLNLWNIMNKKVFAGALVIVLAATAAAGFSLNLKYHWFELKNDNNKSDVAGSETNSSDGDQKVGDTVMPITDDLDQITSTFDKISNQEMSSLSAEDQSISTSNDDSIEINNLINAYDENNL